MGKFFAIFAALLSLSSALFAQTPYRIEGAVYDFTTFEPIAAAEISCGTKVVLSDESGHFVLDCAREGDNALSVEHIAYVPQQITLKTSTVNAPVNIFLQSRALKGEEVSVCEERTTLILENHSPTYSYTITDADIEQNAEKLLQKIPATRIVESNGAKFASIRMCKPSEVLVLVDDMPMTKNPSGTTDISQLNLPDIERIDVFADDIPARYSSLAPGGIINFRTRRSRNIIAANSRLKLLGSTQFGSFGTRVFDAGTEYSLGDLASFSLSGKLYDAKNDYSYSSGDSTLPRANNATTSRTLDFVGKFDTDIYDGDLSAGYANIEQGIPGDVDFPTPESRKTASNFFARSKNTISFQHGITADADVSFSSVEQTYLSPSPWVYVPVNSSTNSNALHLSSSVTGQFSIIAPNIGCSADIETYELQNNLNPSRGIGQKRRDNYAAWSEISLGTMIGKNFAWKITPALRFDKIADDTPMASPAISGSINAGAGFFQAGVAAAWVRSFRAPPFADLYWLRDAFAEGNPDLSPERTTRTSAKIFCGARVEAFSVTTGTTLFWRNTDSVIVWNRSFDGIYRPTNFSAERTFGHEDFAELSVANVFHVQFSSTQLDAKQHIPGNFLDGKIIPFKPEYVRKLSFGASSRGVSFAADGIWTGKQYILAANTKWSEPYTVWNTSVSYALIFGALKVTLSGTCDNVLDTRYETMPGYPMPGRGFSATISAVYTFANNGYRRRR